MTSFEHSRASQQLQHPSRSVPSSKAVSTGHCPSCGGPVTEFDVLIEYTTKEGLEQFAECPHCGCVVHPET
jgi:hypothetical protein